MNHEERKDTKGLPYGPVARQVFPAVLPECREASVSFLFVVGGLYRPPRRSLARSRSYSARDCEVSR